MLEEPLDSSCLTETRRLRAEAAIAKLNDSREECALDCRMETLYTRSPLSFRFCDRDPQSPDGLLSCFLSTAVCIASR